MAFKVTLQPSGHAYEVAPGATVLNAGLAAGWNIPYSCRAGTCRTCRGRILRGSVDHGAAHPAYLTEEQKAKGFALLCKAKPLSDLEIQVQELALQSIKPKVIPCRVKRIRKPAPDVALIDLRLPMNENLMFAAGQFVEFLLPQGKTRSYSIANAPSAEGVIDLELHIRHTPGGLFTDRVFGQLAEGELLRLRAPLGTFYLREESAKPIVLLASGTGFAPIKSMVLYAIRRRLARPITLYWGCRARRDLYMDELARGWEADLPGFKYVPVLSDEPWDGRQGFVHRAVMEDFPDLSRHQVYACGAPPMVDAARRDLTAQCGLPEDEFFADSFLTEADLK
jgi:CDP-4-dehydro-6-deoxyglucose reductase, E3